MWHLLYIAPDTSLHNVKYFYCKANERKTSAWQDTSLDIFFLSSGKVWSTSVILLRTRVLFPRPSAPGPGRRKRQTTGNPALQFLVKISQVLLERKWKEIVSVDTEVMTEELAAQINGFLSHLLEPLTIGFLLKQQWESEEWLLRHKCKGHMIAWPPLDSLWVYVKMLTDRNYDEYLSNVPY